MTHLKLLKDTLRAASLHPQFNTLIILSIIIEMVLPVIIGMLTIMITEGSETLALYMLLLKFTNSTLSMYVLRPLYIDIATYVKTNAIKCAFNTYATVSFQDKITKTSTEYKEVTEPYVSAIYALIEWGLCNFFSLAGNILVVLYVFYTKGILIQLIAAMLLFCIAYHFAISKKQNELTKLDKKLKKDNNSLLAKVQMYLIPFQYKEYTPADITNNYTKVYNNNNTIVKQYIIINNFTSTANGLISLIVCYMSMEDIPSFLLMTIVMNQLTFSITESMWFLNQYNRYKNDYDNFINFLKNVIYEQEPDKLYINDSGITVTSIDIKRDKYSIMSHDEFTIQKGDAVLITGPTGHGKSSLIQAIFGLIPGVTLSHGNPNNYYHTVADYYQVIKEKMPSNKVSLRDFFKGEENNNLIEEYLKLAWTNEEYDRLLAAIKGSFMKSQDNDQCCILMCHVFDLPIDEVLSGGQKSRLILWSRCYQIEKFGKQILVLDEPIPDVDYDTYIKTIKTIFSKYNNGSTIIIMVAHLCECKKVDLNIQWDRVLEVKDGSVQCLV
jgi:ABC-type transport system involved in cytochrome bd biosynthesis fused ATPase/permease subunit